MRILFDLDGTLSDPFVGITASIQHALVALGRPAPAAQDFRWCIGPPLKQVFAKLLASEDNQLADAAVLKYRERFGSIGLFENVLHPGIESALVDLKSSGHSLCVATSKPTIFAERIVEHFGLNKYFSSVNGSELDGTRSDKTSLIAYILERDAIAPSDALMIGDREHDMIGASRNDVAALGVLWGYGSKEELESAGAFSCVTSPPELLEAIRKRADSSAAFNSR